VTDSATLRYALKVGLFVVIGYVVGLTQRVELSTILITVVMGDSFFLFPNTVYESGAIPLTSGQVSITEFQRSGIECGVDFGLPA
jgi:hypothetical protein